MRIVSLCPSLTELVFDPELVFFPPLDLPASTDVDAVDAASSVASSVDRAPPLLSFPPDLDVSMSP